MREPNPKFAWMPDDQFEVAIVGAGPGGATAAYFLSRAGVRTILIDKARFPRDKSCGDAVCGRSVDVLHEMGLEPPPLRNGFARVEGQIFYNLRGDALHMPIISPNAKKAARANGNGRTKGHGHGNGNGHSNGTGSDGVTKPAYVIPREIFDNMLFQHAKKQPTVTTAEGMSFSSLMLENGKIRGLIVNDEKHVEHRIRAKIVMGADGALSQVARAVGSYDFRKRSHEHWIGAFRIYYRDIAGLTDRIEVHFLDELMPGYLWIFPAGDGLANVGAGMVESFLVGRDGAPKMNLRKVTYDLIASHPRFKPRFSGAREVEGSFRGWQLACGSERRKIAGDGWMLIGDAASLIDPFSGEGIHNAMYSGKLAAQAAVDALRNRTVEIGGLSAYERSVWSELGPEFDTAFRLQKLLTKPTSRWLLDQLVHRGSKSPRVRDALIDMFAHGELGQLVNPIVCAKLLMGLTGPGAASKSAIEPSPNAR
jgi:geranylgeranyl reductase family protein